MMPKFLALSWHCKSSKGKGRSTTIRRLLSICEGQIYQRKCRVESCDFPTFRFQKRKKREMVFVLNQRGEALMPTKPQKAKKLLKQKKAKVVGYDPFVIQLLYATGETKQDITLGIDAGSKRIGVSATTKKQELYSAEVELRSDVSNLIATKRQYRRSRRHRKTRYREVRVDN